ncbi:hypothetical protein [Halorussus amylolyticus]|uniref:hypothetical protein n=1 Tax=Halorussus amylolyticus TaxID=1126242 RepID=UPI0010494B10|nr:hypothetical protein [Halorussus amylolyticus]
MKPRRIGVLAGVISALGLVAQFAPSAIVTRWVNNGLEGAVPVIGTTGQSVAIYTLIVESAGPLSALLLAIGFGYYAARHLDVAREYRRFGAAVVVGSLVSVGSIWAVWLYVGQSMSPNANSVLLALLVLVRMIAEVSLVVVGVFAGAALSHFRTNEKMPARPTDADTEESSVTRESTTDSADAQSASA